MPESLMIRYLNHAQTLRLRARVDHAIAMARAELEADPNIDPRAVDHELGLMLARAACRLNLDLLGGAAETIARLEAELAQAKVANPPPRFAEGSHNGTERNLGIAHRAAHLGELEAGMVAHDPHCRCAACRT